jgi:hypothetical protein
MISTFRLTNERGGLGLSCTAAGLSLAGVPLLRNTEAGFVPRSAPEIVFLIKAAYGAEVDQTQLQPSLGIIAQALNSGDLVRATMAAVLTRTPELSFAAAARLARAEEELRKYDPAQPRDWHGRWTTGDGAAPGSAAAPTNPRQRATAQRNPFFVPAAFTVTDAEVDGAEADDARRAPGSLEEEFERKYDDLGPVDFAKQVIQFGSRLEREGPNLSPAERDRALAEYSFLQNRLSFWLGYEYTPPTAHLNLISAALTLYQGATNGGLIRPGDMPQSMVDVAGAAWAFDNVPPRGPRPSTKPSFEDEPVAPVAPPKEIEGLGGIVNNSEAKIVWWRGIQEQGARGWQSYVRKNNPGTEELVSNSKAFDQFNPTTREAFSDKTLNTLSVSYIKNPRNIFGTLKRYIDAAANYDEPRTRFDLDPEQIESKTMHLAVPEYTSPTQWRYLNNAILYGREHGVSVVITRIRE